MRVIAGSLGGRRLRAPRGNNTRPTPDRVREALFASLEPLAGLRVLDLYAGTGALAIEALSRGASHAVLVERSRDALLVLRGNLAQLDLGDRTVVLGADVQRAFDAIAKLGPYDLIFADPPYADVPSGRLASTIDRLLAETEVVTQDSWLVIEHAARDAAPVFETAEHLRSRAYGDTELSFYAPRPKPSPPGPDKGTGQDFRV